MLKELFDEHRQNISYFFDHIDQKAAQSIFESFLECRGMLIFVGVGKSGIIAEKLAMTMIATGTKALYLPAANALHGDIGIASKEDIFVLVSKSGETEELIKLIPIIRKRNAKIVAWVSSHFPPLLKLADEGIFLPVDKELCPYGLAPTTSTAVQLIFGDIIAIALMKAKKFSLDQYALNHPAGKIGKMTLKVTDLMVEGSLLPLCYPDDCLRDVLAELTSKRCGCLLVINKEGELQGIFTDGDLRRALQRNDASILMQKMKDLMTHSFISISKEHRAVEALKMMQHNTNKWVMNLPVLEDKKLLGLIRMHDIVHAGIDLV